MPLKVLLLFLLAFTPSLIKANKKTSNQTNHTDKYEQHANDILNAAAVRMQYIWNRRRDMFFSIAKGRGYNVINQGPVIQEMENNYHHLVYELASNLSTIPIAALKNETLRRQVKRLSKLQLRGLNDDDYERVKEKLHKMSTFLTMRLVCQVKHEDDCTVTVAMVPGIQKEIVRIRRLDELNYYWLKWRQAINERDKAKTAFMEYVRLFRKAASLNGHVTPSRTFYMHYEVENFQKELEDVVLEIMPLYKELHAYLRHIARSVYGNRIIDSDGAIPAPILEQMIHEAWFSPTILVTPYPKYNLPAIQPRLEEIMVQADKINKKAAEYFESLGLNRMSSAFYEKFSRRMSSDEGGPDCKSEIFYFPPDVGLRYCAQLDYKKLMQMHGHMAELQYGLYKKNLPFGLDTEPCPGFSAAIAETAVIASGTPRHLHRLHILSNDSLSEQNAMNRLFRMAVHTILAIPQYFVNDKYFADVLDGRIGKKTLNCGYWKLQYKYAGVIPPNKRNEKHFDPDYKFYRGLHPDKSSTLKFLSEVLGMQFYRVFCLASNQYRPGDPKYPLHNCDYYGSTKAGDMMKEMMKLGATRKFHEILEVVGEKKLSGVGVMEYFAPLFNWLKENNKKLGLDVGWDSDIMHKRVNWALSERTKYIPGTPIDDSKETKQDYTLIQYEKSAETKPATFL